MRFLHPATAWPLAALLVAAVAIRIALLRRSGVATTAAWVMAPRYRASVLRRLPATAFLSALVLLGCAMLDPVVPLAETDVQSKGLDIVIALDLSASMQEQMTKPLPDTRLDATKAAIKTFVGRRIDDRIGLVVFSDNAYVVSPLTFDHQYLSRYIDMVDNDMLRGEGMTAIGEGLALSNFMLGKLAATPGPHNKVIVLFTDGENTAGRDPLAALGQSHAAGIRVHVVGIGLEDDVRKKPQVQALLRAVTGYGGRYFDAASARELDAASRAIDAIEKGVLTARHYQRDAPVFQWFAIPALVALAAAFALGALPPLVDQT
jgi:Ca-activated chloride channel homolog